MKNLKWVAKKLAGFFKWSGQFLIDLLKNKDIILKLIEYHYKIKSKKIDANTVKNIGKVLPKLSKDQMREAGALIEKVITCLNQVNGDDVNVKNKEHERGRKD